MSSKPPPIPKDQRGAHDERRTIPTDDVIEEKGNAGLNLEQQGDEGNLHQNVETVHARTQDR